MRLILECQHDPKTLLRQTRPVPNDISQEELTAILSEMMETIKTERKEIDAHRKKAFSEIANTMGRFRHKKPSGKAKVSPEMESEPRIVFEPLPEGI